MTSSTETTKIEGNLGSYVFETEWELLEQCIEDERESYLFCTTFCESESYIYGSLVCEATPTDLSTFLSRVMSELDVTEIEVIDERQVEINGVEVEKLQFKADSVMVDALLYANGEYSVTVSTFSNAKRQTPWDRSTICAFLFGLKRL